MPQSHSCIDCLSHGYLSVNICFYNLEYNAVKTINVSKEHDLYTRFWTELTELLLRKE